MTETPLNGYCSGAVETFTRSPISTITRALALMLVLLTAAACQRSTTYSGPAGTPSDTASYPNTLLLVSAGWLHDHLNDSSIRVIDLSSIDDYRNGHVPGAVHLWWQDTIEVHNDVYGMMVGNSGVEQMVEDAGITPSTKVVLYDASGGRYAARFLWVLNANGFANVSILNGGRQAWTANKFAMSTESPQVPRGHLDLKLNYDVLIGSDTVKAHLNDSGYVIVDNRTASEMQQTWYDKLALGRIPGATTVPWPGMTVSGSVPFYASAETLATVFHNAGVTPDKTVIVYGLDGVEAAQTYFVLKLLGYPSVQVYDGSWAQWSTTGGLPIEPISSAPGSGTTASTVPTP